MSTIRRFIYLEIASAVLFVTLGFLALFFFFDLVDELRWVGRAELACLGLPAPIRRLLDSL